MIVEAFEGTASEWNAFVHSHPDSTHAHLHAWGELVQRVFGHRTTRWIARVESGGPIVGCLPITAVNTRIFGRHSVSMPYLSDGGPIGDAPAIQALVAAALSDSRGSRAQSFELRSRRELDIALSPRFTKVGVALTLAGDEASILRGFPAKLRSQVKRAVKDGATVNVGAERLDEFYAVFSEHMRDLGSPVLPRRFFAEALSAFAESASLWVVYIEGQPVAASLGFHWRDEFEVVWASSLNRFKRFSPNMLLYWRMMQDCVLAGRTRFNFGRSTPGTGAHRFKTQWGGDETPLPWYAIELTGTKRPEKEDSRFQLASAVWRRLPLRVACTLGPALVRGIP